MTPDEFVYLCLLVISIPLGHLIKTRDSFGKKQYLSTGVGAAIVIVLCRSHGLHSFVTTLVNCLIVTLISPRLCHIVSFVWCFGYLLFFRVPHLFGLPDVQPLANAIQLVLTLKLVGVAFEIHDTDINKKALAANPNDEQLQLKNKYQNVKPSFLDLWMYSYCYIGLMTGPYYKFRTYHDMLSETNAEHIETLAPMLRRLVRAPLYGIGFLVVSHYFSLKFTEEDEFYQQPFWFRLFYMVPMFFIFRMRFYVAWILAECMCITASLGAYPAESKPKVGNGPSDLVALHKSKSEAAEGVAYNFETIHNIDEYGCDLAPTVRDGLRAWNMTIQYWMANHVYRRVPIKSAPVKVALTMGLSAFWHGIHPGYYFSFLSVVPCLIAEDLLMASLKNNRPLLQQQIFDWCCWFHKMRQFDYMSMGFLLLSMGKTFRYWSSIYYFCHIWVMLLIVLGFVLKQIIPHAKSAKGRTDKAEQAKKVH